MPEIGTPAWFIACSSDCTSRLSADSVRSIGWFCPSPTRPSTCARACCQVMSARLMVSARGAYDASALRAMPSAVPTLSAGALIVVVAVGALTDPASRAVTSAPPLTGVGSSDPRGRPVKASIDEVSCPTSAERPVDLALQPAVARDGDRPVDLAARHGNLQELRIDAAAVSACDDAAAERHRRSRHLRRRRAERGVSGASSPCR